MLETGTKDGRIRTWAFVVYPENCSDPEKILREELVPGWISPLHDADLDPDGSSKKPHWHILLYFQGKCTRERVQEISDKCSGVKVQPVKDKRGYARYLCHLDNPEKHQYDPTKVVCLAGADYLTFLEGAADIDSAVGEMMDWCDEQGVYSFAALARFARANKPDWFRVLTSSRSYFMSQYCKSKQWETIEIARGEGGSS